MDQTTYLRDALRELRYKKVMDRFGTFFLHNLDLEHAILGQVVEEDSNKCLLGMSVRNIDPIYKYILTFLIFLSHWIFPYAKPIFYYYLSWISV